MNKEIYRIQDLLRVFGCSRSTLTRLRKDRGFPKPIKVQGVMLGWRKSDIYSWMKDTSSGEED